MGLHRARLQGSLGHSLVFQNSTVVRTILELLPHPGYSSSLPYQLSIYWVPILAKVLIPVYRGWGGVGGAVNLMEESKAGMSRASALNVELCLSVAEDSGGPWRWTRLDCPSRCCLVLGRFPGF